MLPVTMWNWYTVLQWKLPCDYFDHYSRLAQLAIVCMEDYVLVSTWPMFAEKASRPLQLLIVNVLMYKAIAMNVFGVAAYFISPSNR